MIIMIRNIWVSWKFYKIGASDFVSIERDIGIISLHPECKVAKLEAWRLAHLRMFKFKKKHSEIIVNIRNVFTRAHDALLFT